MQRFYFHVRRGDEIAPDTDGEALPDVSAARNEALKVAREMLAEAIKYDACPPEYIEVADDSGRTVLILAIADLLPKLRR